MNSIKSPFPYFGGKSRVADTIWSRFGNPDNYVEPMCGSAAVLLARPHPPRTETINDKDGYIINFYRAIQQAPDRVAEYADYIVSEIDLLARHRWLMSTGAERLEKLKIDPEFYDAQVAGWWVWGICSWIGSGWCVQGRENSQQIPNLSSDEQGINRRLPHLRDGGKGINRVSLGLSNKGEGIREYFGELSERLRNVRICCGEWDRLIGPSVTYFHGKTAILLDPPYLSSEHSVIYSAGGEDVSQSVRLWCIKNGENPDLMIALCGYEADTYKMPDTWESVAWKANGGYGNAGEGRGKANAHRERIWFSPHCLKPSLFQFMNQDQSEEVISENELETDIPEIRQPNPEVIILSKEIVKKEYTQTDLFEFMSE